MLLVGTFALCVYDFVRSLTTNPVRLFFMQYPLFFLPGEALKK